jgi:DNA replication protein DnaC
LYIEAHRYQLALSNIPDEYVDKTIETLPDSWELVFPRALPNGDDVDLRGYAKIIAERRPRNGLFLTSPTTGSGKTATATALAQSFIVARSKFYVNHGAEAYLATFGVKYDILVQFVNTVDLLDAIKAGFSDEAMQAKVSRLIDRIERAELVIFDDIGVEKPTPFVEERFYALLNGLWTRRTHQTLIATSNKTLDQIELTVGPRIRSRLDGLTVTLNFEGGDHRRKNYG